MISGLNRTAFDLAVYASQGWSPTHHARLASGCWSGSTGRDWLPAGFHLKGFKLRLSSSPELLGEVRPSYEGLRGQTPRSPHGRPNGEVGSPSPNETAKRRSRETTAVNIFETARNRWENREISRSDDCTMNSFGA